LNSPSRFSLPEGRRKGWEDFFLKMRREEYLMLGRVVAVCRGAEKGKRKEAVLNGFFQRGMGLIDDAHAGTDKEVSLLLKEKVDELAEKTGFSFPAGAFAENLLVEGLKWAECTPGKYLKAGEAALQITEIGKDPAIPHSYNYCGFSLLPRFGIFARVIQSGVVKTGDEVEWIHPDALPGEKRD
jgi:MOSC domain-containing protein YiiM